MSGLILATHILTTYPEFADRQLNRRRNPRYPKPVRNAGITLLDYVYSVNVEMPCPAGLLESRRIA
jgi:hypothetical protein